MPLYLPRSRYWGQRIQYPSRRDFSVGTLHYITVGIQLINLLLVLKTGVMIIVIIVSPFGSATELLKVPHLGKPNNTVRDE